MLVKLFVGDSFPIELPDGPQQCLWLVHENLPITHTKQAEALLKALRLPATRLPELDLTQVYFSFAGNCLDGSMSFVEHKVRAGANLTCTMQAPSPRASVSSRRLRAGTTLTGEPPSPRQDEDEEENVLSPTGSADATTEKGYSDDEYYEAKDCGWFPFTVQHTADAEEDEPPAVLFPNPDLEPMEADPLPRVHQLCYDCSDMVLSSESVNAAVDRHYKPMLMSTDAAEGKVEKVDGKTFPRWQNRWLVINEKSLDWYESEPLPHKKIRPKGSEAMMDGPVLLLKAVVENPDPQVPEFRKCTDSKMFHFGVVFMNSANDATTITLLFRVPTLQERSKYISYLNNIIKRAANKGATRDPVHWKKWANTFLVSNADIGELAAENDDLEEELTVGIAQLEVELEMIRAAKPTLIENIQANKKLIELQGVELEKSQRTLNSLFAEAESAEAEAERSRNQLEETRSQLSEEMKLHKMLERRGLNKKEEALDVLSRLQVEVDKLDDYHNSFFHKWRRTEQQFKDIGSEDQKNQKDTPQMASSHGFSFSMDGSMLTAGEAGSLTRALDQIGSPSPERTHSMRRLLASAPGSRSATLMLSPSNSRQGSAETRRNTAHQSEQFGSTDPREPRN